MNFFRSEEHVDGWLAENSGLSREILTFDQACRWMAFLGKDRLREDYVHPRVTGELGPFLKSIGLTGDYWKPPA
jgi:hypothetical protein